MEQNIATARVSVARPNWDKSRLVSRIVHLGCGAFHRAHRRSLPIIYWKRATATGAFVK